MPGGRVRSEEHTSELQSLTNLVCRLLLVTATPHIYTLSLHDALPIFCGMLPPRSSSAAARSLWRTSVPLTRATTESSCARASGVASVAEMASAETRRLARDNAGRAGKIGRAHV